MASPSRENQHPRRPSGRSRKEINVDDFNAGELKANDAYLSHLGRNVWLMDNHRWALLVWERHMEETGAKRFILAHADFHWDAGYYFSEQEGLKEQLVAADLNQLESWIEEDVLVRYDSFIAPAVVRKRFESVHFFCMQGDEHDLGLDLEVLQAGATEKVLHDTPESLASLTLDHPLIFDLCLDLFNKDDDLEYGSELWSDAEIQKFIETVRGLIENAAVVTVSLSFGYSGTEEDTRHLAALVVPRILALRAD
jgi:hypothetical protein